MSTHMLCLSGASSPAPSASVSGAAAGAWRAGRAWAAAILRGGRDDFNFLTVRVWCTGTQPWTTCGAGCQGQHNAKAAAGPARRRDCTRTDDRVTWHCARAMTQPAGASGRDTRPACHPSTHPHTHVRYAPSSLRNTRKRGSSNPGTQHGELAQRPGGYRSVLPSHTRADTVTVARVRRTRTHTAGRVLAGTGKRDSTRTGARNAPTIAVVPSALTGHVNCFHKNE